jgi:hypothetical protein
MNRQKVEEIANAVLYEGYVLYPYHASTVKNRKRWNFGTLYPRAFAEAQQGAERWNTQTECLAKVPGDDAGLDITARFLHVIERSDGWQEAAECNVTIAGLRTANLTRRRAWHRFNYPASREADNCFVRRREPIAGAIKAEAAKLSTGLFRIRVEISNTTLLDESESRRGEGALMHSLASAHAILEIKDGEFISLLDPPDEYREAAAECRNLGTYPVLVGDEGQRDAMLCSPIILYDYPQIAPESAGSLFDGTEIDEILTLRILTLSDEEKVEVRRVDERARQILERTESMPPEQLMKMHGALRGLRRASEELP